MSHGNLRFRICDLRLNAQVASIDINCKLQIASCKSQNDLGADAGLGVDLQEQRVRGAAVDDVGLGDAALEGGDARLDLGEHAAGDGAVGDHGLNLRQRQVWDAAVGVLRVRADAVGVGVDDE